jgi:hypothetical protein
MLSKTRILKEFLRLLFKNGNRNFKKGEKTMKKIILAVLFGFALTVLTNWVSSMEMKKEVKAKEEKIIEKKAEQASIKKWDQYTGDWYGQNDASIHITIQKDNQKLDPLYKITIFQNENQTYTFSLQMNSDGTGEIANDKGTFHLEFTHFYDNSSKQLKPSIEIYRVNDSTDNATEKNFFIRAFRK